MARDYAKKPKKKSNSKSTMRILLIGIFIGLLLAGIIYVKSYHEQAIKQQLAKVLPSSSRAGKNKDRSFKFDFYTILPKMKVWEPKQKTQATEKPADITINKTVALQSYVLQVAAFKKFKEADGLRAKLILLGYNAHVEKASTWNRVLVGPYQTQKKAQNVQAALSNQKINSLLLKENI